MFNDYLLDIYGYSIMDMSTSNGYPTDIMFYVSNLN